MLCWNVMTVYQSEVRKHVKLMYLENYTLKYLN